MSAVHVKICGITSVEDARMCLREGAAAIGLNFVPASPRCIDVETAQAIAAAVRGRILLVGVTADLDHASLTRLFRDAQLDCLQLHGDEPPSLVSAFLPHAYKAIRVATREDLSKADEYPGEHLLVDAKVEGALGGTGARVDVSLVAPLARRRRLTLAGGLTPDNVSQAIEAVWPYAVDVASGVETAGDPRRKDPAAVRAFVAAARRPIRAF